MSSAADLERWPAPQASWSAAVKSGRFVQVSALAPTGPSGTVVAGGIEGQTRAVLDQLAATLKKAGSDLSRAATVHVYLRRASDFAAMNKVYATYWPADPPARTTIVAGLTHPDALIEVSAVGIADGAPREVVHPADWMKSPNPYSYAIKSGDTLFMSGLVARNGKDNSVVTGDMTVQVKTLLENGGQILKAAGMSFADVVTSRLFITDAAQFQAMNTAYRTAFPTMPPARATVICELMGPAYLVELTMVAVSGGPKQAVLATNADGTPRPANPNLSSAITAGDRVFVAGMLGNNADNRGNVSAQTQETLSAIGRTLKTAGTDWSKVTDAIVYMPDPTKAAEIEAAWKATFGTSGPARTVVGTGLVAPDGLIEIMVNAVR